MVFGDDEFREATKDFSSEECERLAKLHYNANMPLEEAVRFVVSTRRPEAAKQATDNLSATLEQRGNRYGEFSEHARATQSLKRAMRDFNPEKWDALSDSAKESLEMVAHKIGRILNGDPLYADSWVDIAGYTQLVATDLQKNHPEHQ